MAWRLTPAHAQTRTFRLAIRAPSNGHSLSAIFPVSPSPIGHFGKEQSGTDFGQAKPLGVRQRDQGGRCPPDVRLRDSVVSYTSLQTRLVPQKPRHTIRPKLRIFATALWQPSVTEGHRCGGDQLVIGGVAASAIPIALCFRRPSATACETSWMSISITCPTLILTMWPLRFW
jgi:hypothetical protein